MKGWFLLDVVVAQGSAIFQLFSSEDESLLVWWDTFFVLNLGLDVLNRVAWLNLESDGFTGQSLDEYLHSTTETQDKMKGRFLLDVVVAQGSAIFQLFSGEDESLLVWRDTFFVLNLRFHVLNRVAWLNL